MREAPSEHASEGASLFVGEGGCQYRLREAKKASEALAEGNLNRLTHHHKYEILVIVAGSFTFEKLYQNVTFNHSNGSIPSFFL